MSVRFAQFPSALEAIRTLEHILKGLVASGVNPIHLQVDPFLARGMGYYTGPIFEIVTPDLSGSLGGGGRYNNLIGMFKDQPTPACGVSLGLERILLIMKERKMFPNQDSLNDVMIAFFNEESQEDMLSLASHLRKNGLRVEVYPQKDKLGKQFEYANLLKVRFVAVIGPDEKLKGVVKLKNMLTGSQTLISPIEAPNFIKNN